jgi:arthrofactin-type cyclic lipopeptide synthetase C
VRDVTLGAYAHQDLPFELLVDQLAPDRDLSRQALFQVTFVFQNQPLEKTTAWSDVHLELLDIDKPTSKFDLSLSIFETSDRLSGVIEYASDLFDATTIERFAGCWQTLLENVVIDLDGCVFDTPLLSDQQRQLLGDWNETAAPYAHERCLHELIEAQVAATPDAVAVVAAERVVSYATLDAEANQLAHHLRRLGVGPDARVAVCVERSVELVVSLLAVLKAGGAYVPLDPGYPAERLRMMLGDSEPVAVLVQGAGRAVASVAAVPVFDLETASAAWQAEPATAPARAAGLSPAHLAYVMYTSGSTGTPKGVMVTHGSVVNLLTWMQRVHPLQSSDALLQKTPSSFDASVPEFFWPLSVGARLVMARPDGHRDPAYLWTMLRDQGITTVQFVPSLLAAVLDQAEATGTTCETVRCVQSGGDVLSSALARRCRQWFPGAVLQNLYGPTEAAVNSTTCTCEEADGDAGLPIGRPVANTQAYVLDDALAPVPVGVRGELFIGGVQLARGYLGRPALTAQRFIANPFGPPGARLYRTGDQARWLPDGSIQFLGRVDHQVKLRGFRIELGEIEAVLAEHESVNGCAVIVRGDGEHGHLVAYVTTDAALDQDAIRAHMRARLPEHMIPAAFVQLASLPVTPNGKLDRSALPSPLVDAYLAHGYEAPVGELEIMLAEIWAGVLHLERVGRHDNFFEIGGHSLSVVVVIEQLRQRAWHADVRALFTTPTIAALAASIGRRGDVADVPPNPLLSISVRTESSPRDVEVRI